MEEYLCCHKSINEFDRKGHLCSLSCFSPLSHPNPKCLFCHLSDCGLRQILDCLFLTVYTEFPKRQSDFKDTFIILR